METPARTHAPLAATARTRAAALRRGVRRQVLVHRRLLAALLVAVAVLAGLRSVAPPPPATVSVLRAAHDLPAGAVIGEADLEPAAVPRAGIPDGVVERPEGRTLATPVRRGEMLTEQRLVGPGLLRGATGQVALPVRIPDAESVGLLHVGDRVSLLAGDPASATPTGVTVARAVRVVALPVPPPRAGLRAGGGATGGRLVVLAVSPDVAEIVAGHAARGLLSITVDG